MAKVFTDAGLPADRTAALQSGSVPGAGDVTIRDLPKLHIESKRCETFTLPAWLRQVEDATTEGQPYVIAFRKNGRPGAPESWRGIVDLAWLADLLARVERASIELTYDSDWTVERLWLAIETALGELRP